jgi:hypothetical protein
MVNGERICADTGCGDRARQRRERGRLLLMRALLLMRQRNAMSSWWGR